MIWGMKIASANLKAEVSIVGAEWPRSFLLRPE